MDIDLLIVVFVDFLPSSSSTKMPVTSNKQRVLRSGCPEDYYTLHHTPQRQRPKMERYYNTSLHVRK